MHDTGNPSKISIEIATNSAASLEAKANCVDPTGIPNWSLGSEYRHKYIFKCSSIGLRTLRGRGVVLLVSFSRESVAFRAAALRAKAALRSIFLIKKAARRQSGVESCS
eukprot:Protomagalhaensia_sp_Gyna_25__898@NODE_1431_length_1843_cov_7_387472_g1155_i0_p2_GENE_NODE_1431_length_1843_cov_7_387472_g1155_i0NODE_1431_length_1843_cov_7_387472_g1155_i0_p2_ORF_typecomplete_len109_score6_99_NODE_1431_length_1843_cov_7_387472_g1155_i0351677